MARTVQGKNYTWQMGDTPIGSGDAGEVYAVACVNQPDLEGVLKKPARIATGGTIQRQANQIAQERRALSRLDGLPQGKAHPPRLLDQADELTEGTANYFIISETAPGEDLAAMLAQTRQNDKPFPRRVIITVLDALFDLFSRAHKAGVLWNDMKLEHIYWHNPTGKVSVIDWGNAHFLENKPGQSQPALPRWEDYRQMVNTLGSFLQRNAPELYADLGWDEFEEGELNSPRISILARRIAYQQQVVALKVMEYQSLIKVILSNSPTLAGLQKIQDYQQNLAKIGAPWEEKGVLNYSRSLVNAALAGNNTQIGVKTTAIIWDIFGESLGLSWYLLREYFRYPEFLIHPALAPLAKNTLNENWEKALWIVVAIGREVQTPIWWDRLVPVLRQKAVHLTTPTPYQTGQALLKWASDQGPKPSNQLNKLTSILQDWRTIGDDLEESLFNYALLDFVRDETALPRQITQSIKQSFADGEAVIRDLLKAWESIGLNALPELFEHFAAWDPDRWGIIPLADAVETFKGWLQELYDGPSTDANIHGFLRHLLDIRPPVDRLLGSPPWFLTLMHVLNALKQGKPVLEHQANVQHWCPWLLQYSDIDTVIKKSPTQNEAAAIMALKFFTQQLKSNNDIEAALLEIKQYAPHIYTACKKLSVGFQGIHTTNINLQELKIICQTNPPPGLEESYEVLQTLVSWRIFIDNNDYVSALEALNTRAFSDWRIIQHTYEVTDAWVKSILPWLQSIREFNHMPQTSELEDLPQLLTNISIASAQINHAWIRIFETEMDQQLWDAFTESVDRATASFTAWCESIEKNDDPVIRLLYHKNLEQIHQVSGDFLNILEQSRMAKIGFLTLDARENLTLNLKVQAGISILDHLGAIERIVITDPQQHRVPEWQIAYQQLLHTNNPEVRREMVSSLSDKRTIYTWLVQSIF